MLEMKTWTWDELVSIVEKDFIITRLKQTPKKYKKIFALALATAKWLPSRGDKIGNGACGLCEYYNDCDKCPLGKVKEACQDEPPLYYMAHHGSPAQKEYAKTKMYGILADIYRVEWEKL